MHRLFSETSWTWFGSAVAAPTPVQEQGWTAVAGGAHTLMTAPTGSGKTLAAFFWCIDRLMTEPAPADDERCRVLYISPLKALTVDVERNLQAPLVGVGHRRAATGLRVPDLRVAVRTGDTAAAERRLIERRPPDILITTPESLFLLLTSAARRILRPVRWVIVDEIHSLAGTKRGAHLALSLERLTALAATDPQRMGLSATQRPLEEVAAFLGGDRPVTIVDAGRSKTMEISVEVPVEDMANLDARETPRGGAASAMGMESEAAPPRSIWPAIYPRVLELIRKHRSTIVFVNSRRLAERLAARLNELAGEDLVKAHHGSISREQRSVIEDQLKSGALRGLVATSSLELGIDMGAVDLVVQVESPASVANGIQRIGRSGHSVGAISRGVILPKYRGDLLECAVVVERMLRAEIEATSVLRNPLDVLAQQIVAMCAMDTWDAADLGRLLRRAYPFRDLGTRSFEAVLDMLSGRYPSDEFAELRPRLVWDRVAGTVRGRAGAQRLAVTNAGTIPDRGLYTVNLLEDGRRVGELDEEMVYETRPGETFVLGASTWRVAEITATQVLVTAAPGEVGKIAFWHGDSLSRPAELGRAMGALVRELRRMPEGGALVRLRERSGFDERAARNLWAYVRDQAEATGAVPDDRTLVVERFRDEVGDWRVCILSPFGGRVHAPWALALEARLRDRLGLEVQSIWTDDGVALRLPDADAVPPATDLVIEPEELSELVSAQLHGSALFASRFRENAARALLLPRRRPGSRTPLWQQRQRSADLLQVAGRHPDFPILIETFRECLSDVFDMEALRDVLTSIRSGAMRVVEVETDRASPFAASLLFDYVGQYLYEGDAPLAERRAQALTLDRELLAELLGTEELRELLDPAAIAAIELELQGLLPERFPRDADDAHDVLARLGDLSLAEALGRGIREDWLDALVLERRAVEARIAGETRWIAAEDAGRYREAVGTTLPAGLPAAYLAPGADPLSSLVVRWARTHAPFFGAEPARRWALPEPAVERVLARLAADGTVLSGSFSPGRSGREHCHPEVLRQLRRRSLAALRREAEAVPQDAFARFLGAWQGIGSSARGLDRLLEVVGQLQGVALPASAIERDVLASRLEDYSPRMLDELVSMGEVVWVGRGALGTGDGRVALLLRGDAPRLLAPPVAAAAGTVPQRLREHLERRGASFFRELHAAAGWGDPDEVLDALWDLVWAGEVTNDTFAPLRHIGPAPRSRSRRARLLRLAPPRAAGRWSLVADLAAGIAVTATERLHGLASVLLARNGVLTREAVLAEGWYGGFAGLYPVLRAMEEAGRARRGYFVEGLGGSQFALPGAVDRLRAMREPDGRIAVLAATDPANPYGAVLPWPSGEGRTARVAGALVVLDSGRLRVYLERGGHSLLTFGEPTPAHYQAIADHAARSGRVEVLRVDGLAVFDSPAVAMLGEAGFSRTPRGMVVHRA